MIAGQFALKSESGLYCRCILPADYQTRTPYSEAGTSSVDSIRVPIYAEKCDIMYANQFIRTIFQTPCVEFNKG